jgi:hypothetical protein
MVASISLVALGSRTIAICRPEKPWSASSYMDNASLRVGTSSKFLGRAGTHLNECSFGKRCETGWLPDSFGLTGAYPQIMRQAGMKYFFTQKLSWNNMYVNSVIRHCISR